MDVNQMARFIDAIIALRKSYDQVQIAISDAWNAGGGEYMTQVEVDQSIRNLSDDEVSHSLSILNSDARRMLRNLEPGKDLTAEEWKRMDSELGQEID